MLWWWWLTSKFSFIFLTFVTTLRWCEFEVDDTVDGKENWKEKSMRESLQEKYSSIRAGMWSAVLILGTFKCLPAPMCVTSDSTKVHDHPVAISFFSTRYDIDTIWGFFSRYDTIRYDMRASKKTFFLRNFRRIFRNHWSTTPPCWRPSPPSPPWWCHEPWCCHLSHTLALSNT